MELRITYDFYSVVNGDGSIGSRYTAIFERNDMEPILTSLAVLIGEGTTKKAAMEDLKQKYLELLEFLSKVVVLDELSRRIPNFSDR